MPIPPFAEATTGRPTSPRRRRTRRTLHVVITLAIAIAHLAFAAAEPISGGPRQTLPQRAPAERWTPPSPSVDARFATFPFVAPNGREGLWVLPTGTVPLRFVVEQEVVDRFGLEELQASIEVWNGADGSRFGAAIVDVVDDGVDERRRDGVDRVYLDRRSCGGRYLARANLWPGEIIAREGRVARTIAEVDIGICERMRPDQLDTVVAHELAHIAGLDHLCDEGEDCHQPGMDADNRCRMMSPRIDPCQRITDGDLDGLVHLHPRLPRASGGDARTTSASVTASTHPVPRTAPEVVLSPFDGAPELGIAAASYAAHLGAPHLLVDTDCTTGPAGDALDRVLTIAGRAHLVGDVASGCVDSLEGAWSIATSTLEDLDDVHDAAVEHLPPPTHLVAAPVPTNGSDVGLAAAAATAATSLDAPLVLIEDPDDATDLLTRLEELDGVDEVVAVGDGERIGSRLLASVAATGVEVRRIDAEDGGSAATGLAQVAEIAPAGDLAVTVAAADRPEHLVPAVTLAGQADGLLLPIDREPREDHLALLRDRVTRGALVGGPQAIGRDQQIMLSRVVDGGDAAPARDDAD